MILPWLFIKCPELLPQALRPGKSCPLASSPVSSCTTFPCCWLCFRFRYARGNLMSEPYGLLCLEHFSQIICSSAPLLHLGLCSNVRGLPWSSNLKMACFTPSPPTSCRGCHSILLYFFYFSKHYLTPYLLLFKSLLNHTNMWVW